LEHLLDYALFLAQLLTVVGALLVLVVGIVALGGRQRVGSHEGHIEVRNLNRRYRHMGDVLRGATDDGEEVKAQRKAQRKEEKAREKAARKARKKGGADAPARKPRLYVMSFDGDIRAGATDSLREEISVVLGQAASGDEVLVRIESPGGLVHAYGLAASQLQRIRAASVPLTVAVDKVAASGGYMMACVAERIIAAPFAVIGSIGVLAQLPNFHRLLKKHEIDFELLTAGEYKRTLSLFGENTDKGREKFVEELEVTHALFKEFVRDNRPALDIDRVATGEVWYGSRALEQGLVDELQTSDAFLVERMEGWDVYEVRFVQKKSWQEKIGFAVEGMVERLALKAWQRGQGPGRH